MPTKEKSPAELHQYWQKELEACNQRLKKYKKTGNRVVERFLDEGKRAGGTEKSLNLFHKNTKTVIDMMYGQVPQIDVSREHHDPDDDVARVAGLMYKRILEADVAGSQDDFSSAIKGALCDRLLPGMGAARVRYTFESETASTIDPNTFEPVESESVKDENCPIDYVHWQDLAWGWARTYKEIPWWGFRSWLDKDEVEARFGEKIAQNLEYKKQSPSESEYSGEFGDEQKDNVQKAEIWEFWQKKDKKVFWYSEGADLILDVKDDPLQLSGFWPMPRPMMANLTTSMFVPKADFTFAQDLYNEVDILQNRISIITNAIKVVGVYDKSAGDSVGRMLKEGMENDLIPVDNWAMFAEKGALKGVIDWFPVETVVNTLQVLSTIQKEKIEQLYEVTGMSDIMRGGNTDQYTAAATQGMKAKMGSIGIQSLQDDFARFASELEQLKAEVISKHFSKESIVKQSNAGFLPEADKPKVAQALELMQSPDVKWRVNIKPESISMIDYAQVKQERIEFLMSMAQFIQSASGAVSAVPGSMPILLELMKWTMSGFKGAEYLEGTFDQAIEMAKKPPPQEDKGPSPEETKMEIEKMKLQGAQMKHQGEMQKIQAKSQADMANLRYKIEGEIQKISVDAQRDLTIQERIQQDKMLEMARELQTALKEIEASTDSSVTVEVTQAEADMALEQMRHENNMREIAAQNAGRNNG
ncbi:MAG TPA: hypothetical protein VMV42_00160 [archaeon]|nr:hypothetical protein [archaeon]